MIKLYDNNNAPIINQSDARSASAMNWEDKVHIEPNQFMTQEKCVTDEYCAEGMCSTTYVGMGKTESRKPTP